MSYQNFPRNLFQYHYEVGKSDYDHRHLKLQLTIPSKEWDYFLTGLRESYEQKNEFALTLPSISVEGKNEQWRIYFKIKTGDNRSMVAHPEPGEWAATLALTEETFQLWLDLLAKQLDHTLSEHFSFDRFSNFSFGIVFLK